MNEETKAALKKITDMWSKTGLLNSVLKKERGSLAACLESQRLFNMDENNNVLPRTKRISIPLVARLFKRAEIFRRTQPTNLDNLCYTFECKYKPPDQDYPYKLDAEAEANLILVEEMYKELNQAFPQDQFINFVALSIDDNNEVKLYYNTQEN